MVNEQYDVTSVGVNPARDRSYRMRMYFTAMTLRVACVVSLFWVRGWWIILVAAGAVLLPYFAVLIANAVSNVGGPNPHAPTPRALTGSDSKPTPQAAPTDHVIVVDGLGTRRSQAPDPRVETSDGTE